MTQHGAAGSQVRGNSSAIAEIDPLAQAITLLPPEPQPSPSRGRAILCHLPLRSIITLPLSDGTPENYATGETGR